MTDSTAQLKVEILSYWRSGSGRGSSSHLDALVVTDALGLPYLPGKHIKGLLRNALYCLETWQHLPPGTTHKLMGGLEGENASRYESQPGILAVSNAMLPGDLRAWLAREENQGLIEGFYQSLFSTAVQSDTGTAKDESLRGQQVTVPLTLYSNLTLLEDTGPESSNWWAVIRQSLPLILAVGGHRNRGLGRAVLTLEEQP